MKKDVMIKIIGRQFVAGEEDSVELTTTGSYYRRNSDYFIRYEESEATGYKGAYTTVKVDGDGSRVTMLRSGPNRSQLIVEDGVRHQCCYDVGLGPMMIGISGEGVASTLTDGGGDLKFRYSMDIETAVASEHEVSINVKECAK